MRFSIKHFRRNDAQRERLDRSCNAARNGLTCLPHLWAGKGDRDERRKLSQGPHRQPQTPSRNPNDGLWLFASHVGRPAEAAGIPHLDLRFRERPAGKDFFDLTAGRRQLKPGEKSGLVYSRFNHPNMEILEDRLAIWDGAERCAVFASGMAAIATTCLAFMRPGDTIVHSRPLYGGTETLLKNSNTPARRAAAITDSAHQDGVIQK